MVAANVVLVGPLGRRLHLRAHCKGLRIKRMECHRRRDHSGHGGLSSGGTDRDPRDMGRVLQVIPFLSCGEPNRILLAEASLHIGDYPAQAVDEAIDIFRFDRNISLDKVDHLGYSTYKSNRS